MYSMLRKKYFDISKYNMWPKAAAPMVVVALFHCC